MSTETGITQMQKFTDAAIDGVVVSPLTKHVDVRGWLCELFRSDELLDGIAPAMCYLSLTRPDITRGPHEHREQADWFCFLGPSNFLLRLWDNRRDSRTYGYRMSIVVGEDAPTAVVVPHGVVHGYRNVGSKDGLVVNLPNQLFRGPGRSAPVDEIRHEDDPDSPFQMDGA